MKGMFIPIFFVLSLNLSAQNDTIVSGSQSLKTLTPIENSELRKYLKPELQVDSKYNSALYEDGIPHDTEMEEYDAKLPPLEYYEGPMLNAETKDLHIPNINDYAYYSIRGLSRKAFLTTTSTNETYIGMGQTQYINANLGYQLSDRLSIMGGPFVSKNMYNNQMFYNYGASGKAQFILNDRFRINGYGQYSANQNAKNITGPMYNMYQPTYYGGTIEYKVNDSFGVEAGMLRELNPFTGKWINKPIIAPVFYNNKPKRKK